MLHLFNFMSKLSAFGQCDSPVVTLSVGHAVLALTVTPGMVGLAPKWVRLALKSDLKKPRICPIWGQSDPLWSQTNHPWKNVLEKQASPSLNWRGRTNQSLGIKRRLKLFNVSGILSKYLPEARKNRGSWEIFISPLKRKPLSIKITCRTLSFALTVDGGLCWGLRSIIFEEVKPSQQFPWREETYRTKLKPVETTKGV